jgi:hypothetical protein
MLAPSMPGSCTVRTVARFRAVRPAHFIGSKRCSAGSVDGGLSVDGSVFLKSRKAYSHDDVM